MTETDAARCSKSFRSPALVGQAEQVCAGMGFQQAGRLEVDSGVGSRMRSRWLLEHAGDAPPAEANSRLAVLARAGKRAICREENRGSCSRQLIIAPDDTAVWAQQRLAAAEAANGFDYKGGTLPQEVVCGLPTYFFSYHYLATLAATCRTVCRSVQNLEQWRGRDLALHADEFQSPVIFRRLTPALEFARSVSVRLQQLAMFERLPSNAFLVWDVRGVGPDTFHHSRRLTVVGFRSQGPLLGAASFHLRLPDCATGLYLGVRQWQGHLRSYCRIDNLFRRGSRWAVGLNDALPMPHSGRERFQILPGVTNHFELRWNERSFAVGLNGQGVTRVRTIDMVAEATPPLAEVFVQVFCRNFRAEDQVACRPLPSSMAYNAEIECSICSRAYPVAISRWAICPHCCTWACRSHVRDQPFRFCRHCTLLLADYVGGSAGADEYSAVYVTARGLWYEWQASDIDCVEDKFRRTISMILQQHCPLFLEYPLALDLLPDPSERKNMTKRCWERILHRARSCLDFLTQRKDSLLFMYLHAVAQERLPEQRRRFMDQLVDPRSSHLNIKQWRAEAVCAAARVQMELARDEKKSSWQDRQPRARLLHKAGAAAGNGAFWPLQHELAQDHLRQSQNWQDQPGGSATACSDWAPASSLTPDRWWRLSSNRAEALCKRRSKQGKLLSVDFDFL